ncbi:MULTISPECIES: hypothetical protein [Chryseobacterium]|uniref:Pentapeptide MXKDX repeat protein n=1 Tax=Chryseobacterium geocarposphaerae TaxID=1416776 RepID=A0ABU1LDW4_9FLAO|nr:MULTISPECIES: hypothetical protein [Chryseobacterium]MDR6404917.1 hypothetical protein [Chryseobacterium geocarposphaerae]MDR6697700.1 hypothetical protein [Chryseobacterium ginsenosidimutans]
MKKLILATALLVGTVAVSAQTTPQKRDSTKTDTTNRDMRNDNSTLNNGNSTNNTNGMNNTNGTNNTNSNNSWDKAKSDTTNLNNKDAVQSDRKTKKKNK